MNTEGDNMKKALTLLQLALHVAMLSIARYNVRTATKIVKREERTLDKIVNMMEVKNNGN